MSYSTGNYVQGDTHVTNSNPSFGQPKHYVLVYLVVAFAILIFIVIICIIIITYRRKYLIKRQNDIRQITHLNNLDNEEYNSLDYYLNDYSNENKIFTKPRIPKANNNNVSEMSTRGNRNYKIYAKNNDAITNEEGDDYEKDNIGATENGSTSNNNNKKKSSLNVKSLSESFNELIKNSKNKINRYNTTGNFGLKSNNDSATDVRISSPVTSVSTTSIYDNERANVLVGTLNSRIVPLVPLVPPVHSISSNKKLKGISRGSQMTTVTDDGNDIYKTSHNTFTTININSYIPENTIDNYTTTTNPPIISPQDYPALSHSTSFSSKPKKTGKLQNLVIDSLYLRKNREGKKEKNEEKEDDETTNEEIEYKENDETTKDEEEEEEDNSNKVMVNELELSRESNLFKKTMYRIT